MTHHIDPTDPTTLPQNCTYPAGCSFWDPPNGSFKEIISLSQNTSLLTGRPEQLFEPKLQANGSLSLPLTENCTTAAKCYDPNPTTQSTPASASDISYWFQQGWSGQLVAYSDPANPSQPTPACANSATALTQCTNSRLEVGPNGSKNYKSDIQLGIDNYKAGTDSNGEYADFPVFLWEYGETDPGQPDNQIWRSTSLDGPYTKVSRIIVLEVRKFRFYHDQIASSSASGYYIGYYVPNGTPGNGPPNAIANTVSLVS
jgi:hypothetical protein